MADSLSHDQTHEARYTATMIPGSGRHRATLGAPDIMSNDKPKNVLGENLEICSLEPLTGFTRSGECETGRPDIGSHTVCAQMTQDFLEFSRSRGNDLITPVPRVGFPGLRPGDRWCVCAPRWSEALEAGCAPRVALRASHERALEDVSLDDLKAHAIDLS